MKKPTDPLPPVVFEDEAVIAFDKPAGLLVAPDRWDKTLVSLMRLVHEHLSPEYFNAHRLDRDTSGVLVCAKTREALVALARLFVTREVEKRYLAITRGAPAEAQGVVSAAIEPDRRRLGWMRVSSRGKPSETVYEVLERLGVYAFLRLRPRTGRTHQIRVHLAHLGCPIVADPLYGDGRGLFLSEIKARYKAHADRAERPLIGRLALHAEGIALNHPTTGQRLTIEAPLPKDFQVALKYLRRCAGNP